MGQVQVITPSDQQSKRFFQVVVSAQSVAGCEDEKTLRVMALDFLNVGD